MLTLFNYSDEKITAVKMVSLDRKEAEEFYEVYRNVVPEYSQMVKCGLLVLLSLIAILGRRTRIGSVNCA